MKWEPVLPIQSFDRTQNASGSATSIEFVPGTLDEPWSQWSALSETALPIIRIPLNNQESNDVSTNTTKILDRLLFRPRQNSGSMDSKLTCGKLLVSDAAK